MGQTSSQPAPTQASQSQNNHNANAVPSKKRAAADIDRDGGEERPARKAKTMDDIPAKVRKTNRARPQHRRGTAIRPSLTLAAPAGDDQTLKSEAIPETQLEPVDPDQALVSHNYAVAGAEAGAEEDDALVNTTTCGRAASPIVLVTREITDREDSNVVSDQTEPSRDAPRRKPESRRSHVRNTGAAARPAHLMPTPPESRSDDDAEAEHDDLQFYDASSEHDGSSQGRGSYAAAGEDDTGSESQASLQPPDQAASISQHQDDDSDEYQPESVASAEDESDVEELKLQSRKRPDASHTGQQIGVIINSTQSESADLIDGHVVQDDGEPISGSHSKPINDTRPIAMRQYQSLKRGTQTGKWTDAEKELADEVFWNVCQLEEIDPFDIKASTVDWTNVGRFKKDIYEAFPERSITAIRRFCQRRYSPFESTGKWTAEEDEKLQFAYARYPDNWVSISDVMLRRSAQSCRDRWRSVVKDLDTRQCGPWSTEEEAKLVEVVGNIIEEIQADCQDSEVENDRSALEKLLNWNTVSEKMGGTRSEGRCREKWANLKRRNSSSDPLQTAATPVQGGSVKLSKKQREFENAYAKLQPGDIMDALIDICIAMQDAGKLDAEFHDESTFWSIVAKQRADVSKFAGRHDGGALRRRAYYDTLQKYGHRKKVKKVKGIARKAFALRRRMYKLERQGKLKLTRAYRVEEFPEGHRIAPSQIESGDVVAPPPFSPAKVDDKVEKWLRGHTQQDEVWARPVGETNVEQQVEKKAAKLKSSAKKKKEQTTGPSNKTYKSEEHIVDSDDEVGQTHGRAEEEEEEELQIVHDWPMSSVNSFYDESL